MMRIWTLALFFVRDLLRSLAGIVPLGSALAFGLIAFEYGMDQAQFITVAGVGTGALCLLTMLLLASRANRASSYPFVARLRRRAELLAALVLSSLAITAVLAFLITVGNLLTGRLTLDFPSALWVVPTWLALWLLAATLALPLSGLVGRSGSHLVAWVLLATLLVVNDQRARLLARSLDWLVRPVTLILWPLNTLLSQASVNIHGRSYFVGLGLTLLYAVFLFALAAQIFADKDLLWIE
jgi:hypothetical protein